MKVSDVSIGQKYGYSISSICYDVDEKNIVSYHVFFSFFTAFHFKLAYDPNQYMQELNKKITPRKI